MIGDFKSKGHKYKGWLDTVPKSKNLSITKPKDKEILYTDIGKNKKEIRVSGTLIKADKFKDHYLLIVVRTDRDYPQVMGRVKKNWSFSGCTLGGVDHEIYSVLVDKKDKPIFRSEIVRVRLIQSQDS